MKLSQSLFAILLVLFVAACSGNRLEEKGFPVTTSYDKSDDEEEVEGINRDSVKLETRASNVLLTGISNIRLTTIYKVNLNKRNNTIFIGSNYFLFDDTEDEPGNNWNGNLMPGLEGIYGYNLVNISHYNIESDSIKLFFDKPVLIKTLYYPSFSNDTLNNTPVKRNYFMVSVYNDDTNKDGYINQKDLRRFYLFSINGERQKLLIPDNYSVFKSEYDSDNDFMFVFAKSDNNNNGQIEDSEPVHVFWINLKDPSKTGRQY
jgi:hypothetical protein